MNCANCQKPTPIDEMVADHIVPLSRGGGHGDDNIQWVHRACHRRQSAWYWRLWWSIRKRWLNFVFKFHVWLDSFEPCPKEAMGYNCRHRIMSNGKKECGN